MTQFKYITTTLPYLNSTPHIGHCFEFVLADVIAEFHRFKGKVIFNVGVDEHGQKVYQKAIDEGYQSTQDYCDNLSEKWVEFCDLLKINFDNFYRTSDPQHAKDVLRYYNEIKEHIFTKTYKGNYCVGCEAFVTDKDAINGQCPTHLIPLIATEEENKFFALSKFSADILDILVDKTKSPELNNLLKDEFDLSITRQNVQWGIKTGDGDVFYVWFEALLNYIFAIGYYEDREIFNRYWENSIIICGKDNLKFQAYILQALLLANDVPQTSEVLVHGTILDERGVKMSKTLGNVIDPVEQVQKFGLDPLRYYLTFGLNTYTDSKYSEEELTQKWNSEIVKGLGNLISRLLHLVDIKGVKPNIDDLDVLHKAGIYDWVDHIKNAFEAYNFHKVQQLLNHRIGVLNKRIADEKPYDKDCPNPEKILNEIYWELKAIIPFYKIVLKDHAELLDDAFVENKKIIIFKELK